MHIRVQSKLWLLKRKVAKLIRITEKIKEEEEELAELTKTINKHLKDMLKAIDETENKLKQSTRYQNKAQRPNLRVRNPDDNN